MSNFLIKEQREWLLEHGTQNESGGWVCKETGASINSKLFNYTLYNPSTGGPQFEKTVHPQDEGGCTYKVVALWCTKCGSEPMERPTINVPKGIVEVVG